MEDKSVALALRRRQGRDDWRALSVSVKTLSWTVTQAGFAPPGNPVMERRRSSAFSPALLRRNAPLRNSLFIIFTPAVAFLRGVSKGLTMSRFPFGHAVTGLTPFARQTAA
jgi:hypothetical protein